MGLDLLLLKDLKLKLNKIMKTNGSDNCGKWKSKDNDSIDLLEW